jgi:tetratricopeptide (TPR) repeat protein
MIRRWRAWFLTSRGRWTQAARLYGEMLRHDPAAEPALSVVLFDCRQRGAATEAIDYSIRALSVDPDRFYALKILGWALVQTGDHATARPVIRRALDCYLKQGLDQGSSELEFADRVLGSRMAATSKQSLEEWRRWAEGYLATADFTDPRH